MNIGKILGEDHSKKSTDLIVAYVGTDKKRFGSLVELVTGSDQVLSQRAAWAMGLIANEHPHLLSPHMGKLLNKLKTSGLHAAIPRNVLRGLQEADIDEKFQAEVFDLCFAYIINESQPPAVRAFAITTATNIARSYPELKNELLIVFKDLMQLPQSPAIRSRVKSALKAMAKAVPSF